MLSKIALNQGKLKSMLIIGLVLFPVKKNTKENYISGNFHFLFQIDFLRMFIHIHMLDIWITI